MPAALLTLGKLALLLLLYLFLWRVVRVIASDLADPAPDGPRAAPRPAVAQPERRATTRSVPTQVVLHPVTGAPSTLDLDGDRLLFGRAAHVDHRLEDDYASDEHAELVLRDGAWRIRDLGSTNGTFLNGQKVIAPTAVAAGDQLQLGKTRLEVRR